MLIQNIINFWLLLKSWRILARIDCRFNWTAIGTPLQDLFFTESLEKYVEEISRNSRCCVAALPAKADTWFWSLSGNTDGSGVGDNDTGSGTFTVTGGQITGITGTVYVDTLGTSYAINGGVVTPPRTATAATTISLAAPDRRS